MKRISLILAAAVAVAMSASAEDLVWSGGDTGDWSDVSNWNVWEPWQAAKHVPGVGDRIILNNKTPLHYRAGNAAESEILQKVYQIYPAEQSSVFIMDVPQGQEVTITNIINHGTSPDFGSLFIRGGGTVRFKAKGMFDYYVMNLVVEEGTLYLPDNIDATTVQQNYNLRHLVVSNNATLYLPSNFSPGKDSHINIYTLQGGGTIYNNRPLVGGGHTEVRISGNYPNNEFSGSFGGDGSNANAAQVWLFCQGNFKLTGKSGMSNMPRCMYGYKKWSTGEQLFGLKYFGMTGEMSSIGTSSGFDINVDGGNLLYLGDGETTDKYIRFYPNANGYNTVDAGKTGGLTLGVNVVDSKGYATGGFLNAADSSLMSVVGLNGSNSVPCVLRGRLNEYATSDGSVKASPMVIKKGTGTWRFADPYGTMSVNRSFGGSIQIDEGVFQFDSISPIGEYSSVGSGSMLTETSLTTYEDAPKVNWQFALGGKAANLKDDAEGTLEYTGTKDEYAADRPIVLRGNGRLRANSAGKIRYRMLAPELTKNATLTLDGSSTADNEVTDLVDGATKKLAVVKEGSGKWILSGTNTFTGGLTVKGGTLVLKRPDTRYTWFKFTVKDMCDSFCRAYLGCTKAHTKGRICIASFGLFDEDGNNLIYALTCPASTNAAEIAEGQVGLGTDRIQNLTPDQFYTYGITNMFECSHAYGYYCSLYNAKGTERVYPQLSKPETWYPIVMRLNPGKTASVKTYDWSYYYSIQGENHGLQWNPSVWSLEGSVDGIHWDNVKTDADTAPNWTCATNDYETTNYHFFFSKAYSHRSESLSAGSVLKHSGGCEINGEAADVFPVSISSAKVSGGSTFKFEGVGKLSMGTLELDTSANTIDGVMFNSTGDLNITGTLAEGGSVPLATTFNNCSGVASIANWAFTINGVARPSYTLAYEDGKLVVKRPGILIIVR